jgi:signal peptidase II
MTWSYSTGNQYKSTFMDRRYWTIIIWAFAAVIIDQCSKLWVRRILEFGEPHAVIDGWLYFTRAQNFGAAWSVLSGQRIVLVLVTLAVIGVLIGAAKELSSNGIAARIGLGLVLGGAFGNLIDRLLFGHVTDFIDMGSPWHWLATFPVFNIADSCLTVGAILLALSFLLAKNTS